MTEIEFAILQQKLEFLTQELEEAKAREQNQKTYFEKLIATLEATDPSSIAPQSELEKANAQFSEFSSAIKDRYVMQIGQLEQSLENTRMESKIAEIEHKRQIIEYEQRDLDLAKKVQYLESENAQLKSALTACQQQVKAAASLSNYELQIKLASAQRENSILKEKSQSKLLKYQIQAETDTSAQASAWESEKSELLSQIKALKSTKTSCSNCQLISQKFLKERQKRRDMSYDVFVNESRETTERRGDIRAEIDSLVANILNRSDTSKGRKTLDFSVINTDADTESFISDDDTIIFK